MVMPHQVMVLHGAAVVVQDGQRVVGLDQKVVVHTPVGIIVRGSSWWSWMICSSPHPFMPTPPYQSTPVVIVMDDGSEER